MPPNKNPPPRERDDDNLCLRPRPHHASSLTSAALPISFSSASSTSSLTADPFIFRGTSHTTLTFSSNNNSLQSVVDSSPDNPPSSSTPQISEAPVTGHSSLHSIPDIDRRSHPFAQFLPSQDSSPSPKLSSPRPRQRPPPSHPFEKFLPASSCLRLADDTTVNVENEPSRDRKSQPFGTSSNLSPFTSSASSTSPFSAAASNNLSPSFLIRPEASPFGRLSISISSNSSLFGNMVKEREPPRGQTSSSQSAEAKFVPNEAPQFGKPSILQSPLQNSVFNKPKPGRPRPEHHRPKQHVVSASGFTSVLAADRTRHENNAPGAPQLAPLPATIAPKSQSSVHPGSSTNAPVAIARPSLPYAPPIKPSAPPIFSSSNHGLGQFVPVNSSRNNYDAVRYTTPVNVSVPSDAPFGAPAIESYVDPAQANSDIKALLEGAMEDEDDKPRTRSRKAASLQAKTDELAGALAGLNMKPKEQGLAADDDQLEGVEDDGSVEGLKVKLLPHQIDGVDWMREKELGKRKIKGKHPKGGILADDMGLGKTIQTIALLLINPRPSPEGASKKDLPNKVSSASTKSTLVIAPLALIKQWESEIREKVEPQANWKVLVHHGPARTKRAEDLRKYDVVITTYQTLVSEHGNSSDDPEEPQYGCFGAQWYRVVLDEAHTIKNRNAKATQACCALRATYRWCLTGTPMQNNLDELQSLIHFLRIRPYDDLSIWKDQIVRPLSAGRGRLAISRLQYYLKAIMKRRTKDVLKQAGALTTGTGSSADAAGGGFQITKRDVKKVVAEFSPSEQEYYDRLEQRTGASIERMMGSAKLNYASALVLLLRLRQACNHTDLVERSISGDKDAMSLGQISGSQTPRKSSQPLDDLDDMANLMGNLSVQSKRCEVCMVDLTSKESASGQIRCQECEADRRELSAAIQGDKDQKSSSLNRAKAFDGDESGDDSSDDQTPDSGEVIASSKIRELLCILCRESAQHKFIVFSQFTTMLDLIEPFLRRQKLVFARYDGSMRNDQREASLDRLRNDHRTRILLCSLKCGSLGLNLTAASRVVIIEPFWNPFVEEQAIDRVHRLNQTADVVVYKLTIANSVEARIFDLQEQKRALAEAAIEGKAVAKLSMQDILRLFRHDAEHHDVPSNTASSSRGASNAQMSNQSRTSDRDDFTPPAVLKSPSRSPGYVPSTDGIQSQAKPALNTSAKPTSSRPREDPVFGRRW